MTRPNFFIVGAPRCGTTALYAYLQQHPDVYMPYRKEPHYFGDDLPQRPPYFDERAYLRLFDAAGDAARVGEATVWYLYSDSAAQQIRSFSPDARIIIMLRRPVEMMYSLHGLFLFTTWEDLTDFGEAIDAEADRGQGRRLPPNTWWQQALQYRWLADYAPHVERYLHLFGPERVKVIVYDDFRADTESVVRDTLGFLGLDPSISLRLGVVNRARTARSMRLQRLVFSPPFLELLGRLPPRAFHVAWRSLMRLNLRHGPRPELDPRVDATLTAELEPAVQRLEAVLGRPLPTWRHPRGARP
ncbi:MAG: sulfotransferase [Chloroflexi bacterium]|nr:sulfotransferase [Chloroflexota bacterium]